jgi:two-component system response regulator GlrR
MAMGSILIVDDDAVIRGLLYELFSTTYECHTASTAEEAFQYLEVEDYDAILTDIAMPGLTGIELLKRVQLLDSDSPVILISGRGNEQDPQQLISLGAFAYLSKPFNLMEIEETVAQAVAQKDSHQTKSLS